MSAPGDRVHVAADPVGVVQACAACGAVLVDYSLPHATAEAGRIVEARPVFYQRGAKVLEVRDGLRIQTHDGTPATCR